MKTKKEKIIELHNAGRSVKEIMHEVDAWDTYIRLVIKTYKIKKELETLKVK